MCQISETVNRWKYILDLLVKLIIIVVIVVVSVPYLLQISFVLVSVGVPHVPLLRPGVAEGDQALHTLQTLVQTLLTCTERRHSGIATHLLALH